MTVRDRALGRNGVPPTTKRAFAMTTTGSDGQTSTTVSEPLLPESLKCPWLVFAGSSEDVLAGRMSIIHATKH